MPIIGIGTDIVEVARFASHNLSQRFLHAVFTESELAYSLQKRNSAQHLAARFAAKEAATKALSGTIQFVSICQIEVFHDENNVPCLRLIEGRHGEPALQLPPGAKLHASLSHSEKCAVATVILEIALD